MPLSPPGDSAAAIVRPAGNARAPARRDAFTARRTYRREILAMMVPDALCAVLCCAEPCCFRPLRILPSGDGGFRIFESGRVQARYKSTLLLSAASRKREDHAAAATAALAGEPAGKTGMRAREEERRTAGAGLSATPRRHVARPRPSCASAAAPGPDATGGMGGRPAARPGSRTGSRRMRCRLPRQRSSAGGR